MLTQRDIGYSITITEMAKKRGLEARKGTRRSERVAKRSKVEAADLPVHTDPTTALTAAVAVAIAGPALPTTITEPMQEIFPAHVVVDVSTKKGFMEETADVVVNGST
jgi:5-enolpyruvylshikimate-3-phosphate synthase